MREGERERQEKRGGQTFCLVKQLGEDPECLLLALPAHDNEHNASHERGVLRITHIRKEGHEGAQHVRECELAAFALDYRVVGERACDVHVDLLLVLHVRCDQGLIGVCERKSN